MLKVSGYRISPHEVEDVVYATGTVTEVAAIGVDHPLLGQAIVLVAVPRTNGMLEPTQTLIKGVSDAASSGIYGAGAYPTIGGRVLPRNPNGENSGTASYCHSRLPHSLARLASEGFRSNSGHAPQSQFSAIVDNCFLQIGGMPLTQLAPRVGTTPFYAYDRSLLLATRAQSICARFVAR